MVSVCFGGGRREGCGRFACLVWLPESQPLWGRGEHPLGQGNSGRRTKGWEVLTLTGSSLSNTTTFPLDSEAEKHAPILPSASSQRPILNRPPPTAHGRCAASATRAHIQQRCASSAPSPRKRPRTPVRSTILSRRRRASSLSACLPSTLPPSPASLQHDRPPARLFGACPPLLPPSPAPPRPQGTYLASSRSVSKFFASGP